MKFLKSASFLMLIGLLLNISHARAELKLPFFADTDDYQIGAEWGKKEVNLQNLSQHTDVFQRAARATARYGGGTAFYLGKIGGRHLVGTNHHVQSSLTCQGRVTFTLLLGAAFSCTRVYGSWPEVDFALFEITVPADKESVLNGVGRNFAFDARIYPGQELVTVGHGVAGNFSRGLMGNEDSDCKVFSGENDFRLLPDPDELNPGSYEAWSFANGCDVSHGDSGSAFVDRRNGDVIGIVWTGRIPKNEKVRDANYLRGIFENQSPEVWTELTLTVPAPKIHEYLLKKIQEPGLDESARAAIDAFLRN
jgi:hypothetical protein